MTIHSLEGLLAEREWEAMKSSLKTVLPMACGLSLLILGCTKGPIDDASPQEPEPIDFPPRGEIRLRSSDFRHGEMLPVRYTCDGEDISPPLRWSGLPKEAVDLGLIFEDIDAGDLPRIHWMRLNISPSLNGMDAGERLRASKVLNDFDRPGYAGPCPPQSDPSHRYIFTVYAFDEPYFPQGINREEFLTSVRTQAIEVGRLAVVYGR